MDHLSASFIMYTSSELQTFEYALFLLLHPLYQLVACSGPLL